jgi:hypothetical protein
MSSFDVLVHITGLPAIRVRSEEELTQALSTFADLAERDLRAHPYLPRLYKSRVRYLREMPGVEIWQLPSEVYTTGVGDCEDLSAWRRAELRVYGDDPAAKIRVTKTETEDGGVLYHITVLRGDGSVDDPSKVLGMGTKASREEYERALYRWENARLYPAVRRGANGGLYSADNRRVCVLPPPEDL